MARQNYGSLRGRRGGGAWQWTVIGFVVGFGCAAIIGLVLIISGVGGALDGLLAANRPTQTPVVITSTPLPATSTPTPTEILLVAPSPTATAGQVEVILPSPTATIDPNLIRVESSPTPTTQVAPTQSASGPVIPTLLEGKLTLLNRVEGGTFEMGTTAQEVSQAVQECISIFEGDCKLEYGEDSAPPHSTTLDPFQMETREVTYEQYLAFLNSKGPNSHRTGCDGQLCIATRAEEPNSNIIFDSANYRVNNAILNYPVVGITWYGANAYCQAIGRRLPSEAEWERSARGAENYLYPWGNTFDATFARTSRPKEEDPALVGAKAVQSYPAGAFGLYDMAGNVAEWVADWYSPTYYQQQLQSGQAILNPTGPVAGTQKVVRGGSWDAVPFFARAVHRQSAEPQDFKLWIGFRCAADIDTGSGLSGQSVTPVSTPLDSPTSATGNEEETANSSPTLPPPPLPTSNAPLPTLAPGG